MAGKFCDDMARRIALGDTTDIQNPMLVLELLANPRAEWWVRGCHKILLRALGEKWQARHVDARPPDPAAVTSLLAMVRRHGAPVHYRAAIEVIERFWV